MADQSDVEQALAGIVAGLLYPAGDSAEGSGASTIGPPARVFRGWPDAAALARDLAAGIINVSIAADAEHQTNTTRYIDQWRLPPPVAPTLTAAVLGNTVVFDGDAGPGQIAGVLVDGLAGVHRTVAGDTPVSVAEAIAAALISRNAMASGPSVLVLGAVGMIARVVADQPGVRETRRQRQVFRVVCWCPDPSSRDAVAGAIDGALSDIAFLSLADGLSGRMRAVASVPIDRAQAAALYRRDLLYSVEYATSIRLGLPTLLFGNETLATAAGVIATHLS
jgi:hypothetical protein